MSQNKAFSTPFILAVLCIYFSYFLHGISVITLAQNMSSLAEKFSTDNAGIAYLMFYPMLVSYMLLNNIWYGYGLIIPGILFVLITLMLLKSKFPSQLVDASVANELPQMNSKPLVWLEGVSSVLFGVAAFSTFYVIVVWMPKYAMAFAGMSEAEALKTISYYSMGSLVCVFIFAALLKKWSGPSGLMYLTLHWQQ